MGLIKSGKSKKSVSEVSGPVISGNLRLHELRSRIFRNMRLVRVWLPPDYDASGAIRYPVLYVNDGQNLFDPATAFAGVHWRVVETGGRLVAEGKIPPLLIVGIDNTSNNRLWQYIQYRSVEMRLFGPQQHRYPEFLLREVMPL